MEDYIRTIREFYALIAERLQLTDDAIAIGTAGIFRQALRDQASMSFQFALQQLPNQASRNFQEVVTCIAKTSIQVLGHEAHMNQVAYLRDTKKPRLMTIDEWLEEL